MIVDAYNNIWEPTGSSDYLTGDAFTVDELLAAMGSAGVDAAVVCSLGQQIDNDFVARSAAGSAGRLVGFGQVDPRRPGAVAEIERCATELGLRGLKLHPTLHGYHVADHGLLDPVLAACAEHGLVVLINALDDPFCGPLAIEEVVRGFPEVPVLIAHMGTVWNVPEALIVAGRQEHVYLETSSTQLLEVKMAYERLGPSKLVMGTDWPGSDFELERLKLRKAIPDDADRAQVEGGTLATLLGLPAGG